MPKGRKYLVAARGPIYQWRMQSRLPLSVAVITLNEEVNLPRCLGSIRDLAAELVIVDSGSTDRTQEISRQMGALFIAQPWLGFTRQKNFALERCSQPWALCLDADEAVSPELAEAIRRAFASPPSVNGFELNRRTSYLGKWIWHAWYPEWCLRLVRREAARWAGADPHPSLSVTGATAKLSGDLLHYSYGDLQEHLERTLRYARTSADTMALAGRRCCWYHLVISPWFALGKRLILKQGFRDGWRGWIIAYSSFLAVFAKYAFLAEQQRLAQRRPQPPTDLPTGTSSASRPPGPA